MRTIHAKAFGVEGRINKRINHVGDTPTKAHWRITLLSAVASAGPASIAAAQIGEFCSVRIGCGAGSPLLISAEHADLRLLSEKPLSASPGLSPDTRVGPMIYENTSQGYWIVRLRGAMNNAASRATCDRPYVA